MCCRNSRKGEAFYGCFWNTSASPGQRGVELIGISEIKCNALAKCNAHGEFANRQNRLEEHQERFALECKRLWPVLRTGCAAEVELRHSRGTHILKHGAAQDWAGGLVSNLGCSDKFRG